MTATVSETQPATTGGIGRVAGVVLATVLGVALFRGVPVGPLIAAGLVSLFIGKS